MVSIVFLLCRLYNNLNLEEDMKKKPERIYRDLAFPPELNNTHIKIYFLLLHLMFSLSLANKSWLLIK